MALSDFMFWKKAPDRKPSDQPSAPGSMLVRTQVPIVTYDNYMAAEVALAHPFTFFCLTTVARAVACVPWYAVEDERLPANQRAGATELKAMTDLLNSPHPTYSDYQLKYWMALNYACYGRIPLKVGRGVENRPNGLYPLAAKDTKVNTDGRGLVQSMTYGFGNGSETLPIRAKATSNGSAYGIDIMTPTLSGAVDLTGNINPLRAIGLPSKIMRLLMERAAETADGHPNTKYIFSSEKTLTANQKDAVQEHVENRRVGGSESGEILFLHGVTLNMEELNNDLSDIHSKMPTDDMARMIARIFGIPNALIGLGAADGAKFANNFDGARAYFYEDTIIPGYCDPIATGLTAGICPPGMRIMFDYDGIPSLAAARAARAKDINTLGFLTIDERRQLAGYEKLGTKEGSQLGPLPAIAPTAPPVATENPE